MSEEANIDNGNIKTLIFLFTPYAFLCAILYLYSFWSTFNINFLEYITIGDILKITTYPIIGGSLGFLVGQIYSFLEGEKGKSKTKQEALFWWICIILLMLLLIILHFEVIFLLLAILLGGAMTRKIIKFPSIKKLIPNHDFLFSAVFIGVTLPMICFAAGTSNAIKIKEGYFVRYAKTSQFQEIQIFGQQTKIKYIGLGGKHFFFSSEDNEKMYIINSEKIGLLELSKPSKEAYISPWKKMFKKKVKEEKTPPSDISN